MKWSAGSILTLTAKTCQTRLHDRPDVRQRPAAWTTNLVRTGTGTGTRRPAPRVSGRDDARESGTRDLSGSEQDEARDGIRAGRVDCGWVFARKDADTARCRVNHGEGDWSADRQVGTGV